MSELPHINTLISITLHRCNDCCMIFSHESQLQNHRFKHKMSLYQLEYKCLDCGRSFTSEGRLNQHIKVHQNIKGLFVCDVCGKHLSSPKSLKRHKESHTRVQPYSCNVCGVKFTLIYNLIRHQKKQHQM